MHAQKEHVVRDGAPGVGCQEEGPEWCGAQVHGERDLRAYERGCQCGGARVRSHEAFDLGVRFQDRHAALGVRVEGGHGERREGCVVFYTDAVRRISIDSFAHVVSIFRQYKTTSYTAQAQNYCHFVRFLTKFIFCIIQS